MVGVKKAIIRAGLETLFFSGAYLAMRPFVGGVGVILTLHHVRPPRPDAFQPNRLLEVTPEFFRSLVRYLRRANVDLVSLDEVHRRLVERDFKRRFVALTFDDAYRDLAQWAYPVMVEHGVPFTLFIPTSFPDHLGELWWLGLEAVIAQNSRIGLVINGEDRRFDCATISEKRAVHDAIYWWLRSMKTEDEMRRVVRDLCSRYHVDMNAFCSNLCMTWEEIAKIASNPLATIGAHSVNHGILKRMPEATVCSEMKMSRSVIEAALGVRPKHFAYPVGDATSAGPREFAIAAQLGFDTAVTTRPGVLFPDHRDHLTALPRISVNGEFQQLRYLRVLASGAATAIWNGFRHVHAA